MALHRLLWEEIKDLEIVKYIDVLLTDLSKRKLKMLNFNWKGSAKSESY